MTIHIQHSGNKVIVTFAKAKLTEISDEIVAAFDEAVQAASDSAKRLVIDFGGVQFLGSSVLSALIQLSKHARNRSVDLRFVNLRSEIVEVFKTTNNMRMFRDDDFQP